MPQLSYYLSTPEPHTHYFEVEIKLQDYQTPEGQDYLDFVMPVWTPGSYLVREFARHVENFQASQATDQPLSFRKISKNTWRVFTYQISNFSVRYQVYAFDMGVRTSFLDVNHAFINGASVFMYADGLQEQSTSLVIHAAPEWTGIATSLSSAEDNPFHLEVPNYDVLVDSPIEVGNFQSVHFEAEGIPHHLAVQGFPEFEAKKFVPDFQTIIGSATHIFGENPCEAYTFIIHLGAENGGGLEHADSCSLQFSREQIQQEKGYQRFLSLVAHEYFHLWNVKRLRPLPLGPFDYSHENYCSLLWQAEGFTSYYEKIILLQAQLIDSEAFFKVQTDRINHIESQAGNYVQSLSEASMDAWIKAYRPNENSPNATISYYTKGAVIALLLDLSIIHRSDAQYNLDDVMRHMYQEYYKKADRGFSEEELRSSLEQFYGQSLQAFFDQYIHGTDAIDYPSFFTPLGLALRPKEKEEETKSLLNWGFDLKEKKVSYVKRGSRVYSAGLNVGDEIITVDQQKIEDLAQYLSHQQEGTKIYLQVIRDGLFRSLTFNLHAEQNPRYQLVVEDKPTFAQERNLKKWLRG